MNESERIAYDWLLEQGVEASAIVFRARKTPDFVVDGGRGYEVKRLYGKSIRFTSGQTGKLLEHGDAEVLVVDGDAVVASIKASVFASRPAAVKGFAVSYQEGQVAMKLSSADKGKAIEMQGLIQKFGYARLPESVHWVFADGITQAAVVEAALHLLEASWQKHMAAEEDPASE